MTIEPKKTLSHADFGVSQAVQHLRNGGVLGLPTETVYGLAADISNPQAIEKIFTTKERPFFDPLIVHIADITQLAGVVSAGAQEKIIEAVSSQNSRKRSLPAKLAEKFWPGPLTMVLPKHPSLNTMITSGLETVGVRMPKHPLALEVIRQLGSPLAAPSANKFGRTSPTTAAHVHKEFNEREKNELSTRPQKRLAQQIPVLDGGPCEVGVESTVIGFNDDFTEIFIYRPGAITQEMLAQFAPTTKKQAQLSVAPGQLQHHYMPNIPLVWMKNSEHLSIDVYENLCRQLQVPHLRPSWVELSHEPALAARELYASLRTAAARPYSNCILLKAKNLENSSISPSSDLRDAVIDRLTKAATLIL